MDSWRQRLTFEFSYLLWYIHSMDLNNVRSDEFLVDVQSSYTFLYHREWIIIIIDFSDKIHIFIVCASFAITRNTFYKHQTATSVPWRRTYYYLNLLVLCIRAIVLDANAIMAAHGIIIHSAGVIPGSILLWELISTGGTGVALKTQTAAVIFKRALILYQYWLYFTTELVVYLFNHVWRVPTILVVYIIHI